MRLPRQSLKRARVRRTKEPPPPLLPPKPSFHTHKNAFGPSPAGDIGTWRLHADAPRAARRGRARRRIHRHTLRRRLRSIIPFERTRRQAGLRVASRLGDITMYLRTPEYRLSNKRYSSNQTLLRQVPHRSPIRGIYISYISSTQGHAKAQQVCVRNDCSTGVNSNSTRGLARCLPVGASPPRPPAECPLRGDSARICGRHCREAAHDSSATDGVRSSGGGGGRLAC